MRHVFGGTVGTAVLNINMSSGERVEFKFDSVQSLSTIVSEDSTHCDEHDSRPVPSGIITIELKGHLTSTSTTPERKVVKPELKQKKPTVKMSVIRVRSAEASVNLLIKSIYDAESALLKLKNGRERLNVELKAAREQLLASATSETRFVYDR